jgi:hypothetical protein
MRVVSLPQCGDAARAQLASLFSTRTRGGFANRWVEQVPAARGKHRVCGLIRMHNFDERTIRAQCVHGDIQRHDAQRRDPGREREHQHAFAACSQISIVNPGLFTVNEIVFPSILPS